MKNIKDELFEIYIGFQNFHTAESMAETESEKLEAWNRFYDAFNQLEKLYNSLPENEDVKV